MHDRSLRTARALGPIMHQGPSLSEQMLASARGRGTAISDDGKCDSIYYHTCGQGDPWPCWILFLTYVLIARAIALGERCIVVDVLLDEVSSYPAATALQAASPSAHATKSGHYSPGFSLPLPVSSIFIGILISYVRFSIRFRQRLLISAQGTAAHIMKHLANLSTLPQNRKSTTHNRPPPPPK